MVMIVACHKIPDKVLMVMIVACHKIPDKVLMVMIVACHKIPDKVLMVMIVATHGIVVNNLKTQKNKISTINGFQAEMFIAYPYARDECDE